MLRKVTIHRFRSCRDLTIEDMGPSLVLVGRNGAGKTNILRAISWAARTALRSSPLETIDEGDNGAVSLEFDAGDLTIRYSIENHPVMTYSDKKQIENPNLRLTESIEILTPSGTWELAARREGGRVVSFRPQQSIELPAWTPFIPYLISYPPPGFVHTPYFLAASEFLRGIRYYPFDELNYAVGLLQHEVFPDIISKRDYETWKNSGQVLADRPDAVLLKLLDMSLARPDDFAEVKHLVDGQTGLGLVSEIEVRSFDLPFDPSPGSPADHPPTLYIFQFIQNQEVGGQGRGFRLGNLSLGTRRTIRMIVSLVFDRSSVMLIEHPEDGLHRMMAEKLFSTLQSYTDPSQIIVTTHSTTIFNMLEPDEARIVSMEDGVTRARAFTALEAESAKRYMSEEGAFSDFVELHEGV